jgi:hypothetical protein
VDDVKVRDLVPSMALAMRGRMRANKTCGFAPRRCDRSRSVGGNLVTGEAIAAHRARHAAAPRSPALGKCFIHRPAVSIARELRLEIRKEDSFSEASFRAIPESSLRKRKVGVALGRQLPKNERIATPVEFGTTVA